MRKLFVNNEQRNLNPEVALSRLSVTAFFQWLGHMFTVQNGVSCSDEIVLTLGFCTALAFGLATAFAPEA